jgi:hypothetical protein
MLLSEIPFSPRNDTDNSAAFRALVVAQMLAAAPLLQYAQFYTMAGNADAVPRETAEGLTVTTRAINSSYTPQTNTFTTQSISLSALGGQVQTDIAIERRGEDLNTRRVQQLESYARSLGRQLQAEIIGAPSVAVAFQTAGGHSISHAAKNVFNATQLMNFNGANGGQVLLGNSDASKQQQQQFIEALNNLIASIPGGADVIIANAQVISRLGAIGREYLVPATMTDVYGREMNVTTFGGDIPVINAGFLANGTGQVISNTETLGTSTNCTSIYAVKFGTREMFTLATNVGLSVTDNGTVGQQATTTIELDCGGLAQHSRSVACLQGVRLS